MPHIDQIGSGTRPEDSRGRTNPDTRSKTPQQQTVRAKGRLWSLLLLAVGIAITLGLTSCFLWDLLPENPVAVWEEDFEDFDQTPYAWDSTGCSSVDEVNGVLLLTEEEGWCRARFFLDQPHLIDEFTVEFDFRMGRSSTLGGDGFTFAFVEEVEYGTPGSNYVHNSGKWLDFEGASGYAVEFDTYHNSETDPGPANHIAIIQDSVTNHLGFADAGDLEDGVWHHAHIAFNQGHIETCVDGVLVLSHTIQGFQPFEGYFGFTAATGTAVNYHEIDNIRLWDSFMGGQEGKFRIGSMVKVTETESSALRIRDSAAGNVQAAVPAGWVFEICGGPQTAQLNGAIYRWWFVQDAQYDTPSLTGWVAERYLRQISKTDLDPQYEEGYFSEGQPCVVDAIARARVHAADETLWYYPSESGVCRCLGFVCAAYGKPCLSEWTSARAALDLLTDANLFHPADESWNPPPGALVFFESNLNPQYDHVGLFLGGRDVAHVEGNCTAYIRDLGGIVEKSYIDEYLGWAYPPEEWLEPDESLVAYYDFDEAVGMILLDQSQHLNNGEILGVEGILPGRIGNAYSLDGIDDYVEVPSSESLQLTSAITIEAWVFVEELTPGPVCMIVNKEGVSGFYEIPFEIGILAFEPYSCFLGWHLSEPQVTTTAPDVGDDWHEGGGPIPLDRWTHVALTYDGATVRTYLDGTLQREFATYGNLYENDNALRIGARGAPGDPIQFFRGSIDELRIYNRALPQSEIHSF